VNNYAASDRSGAALASAVSERADRIQANIDTLEARVEERTDEVRRLLEARTQFFAALSHELRTPLAVILRQSESILAAPGAEPDATAYSAGIIRQSAAELLAIVNDVLELARAETGHLEVDFETIDLLDVLRGLQPTLEGLAHTSEVDFTYDVPDDPLPMRADGRRLREVILNLVDNAFKYTPPGGAVRVTVRRGTSVVELTVDDTGVGIAHDQRHQIFEPFYRAPGVETQRGEPSTGLGLALTKRVVQAHEGQIYCIPGEQGTRFVAILPVRSNVS
jgi:signal transduction histidine kinase